MSNSYRHSVTLKIEECNGCTTCLKRCPTEAIRVRDGHAVIRAERCIDCGECIRVCPNKAKRASYDPLSVMEGFDVKIALPAPALYGQFDRLEDPDIILEGLLRMGFDGVFEVARAAELVSGYTRRYLRREDIKKPVISSACPAVARIISVRFPSLCENVLPLLPPVEMAARLAKEEAAEKFPDVPADRIGCFFISPCPAKVSYVKNPETEERSAVDGVLSMSDVYFRLISEMRNVETPSLSSETGLIGVSWAATGGESAALFNDRYLAADGIENVIKVLDEIENEHISDLEFVELNACNGGCVGGALTVENPYIAKARLQNLKRYLPVSRNLVDTQAEGEDPCAVPDNFLCSSPLTYQPVTSLSADKAEAMQKMLAIESLYSGFPHMDCGSCGAPTCRALAEDIVSGEARPVDCIIKWRDEIKQAFAKVSPVPEAKHED